jgi:hypothetical protein
MSLSLAARFPGVRPGAIENAVFTPYHAVKVTAMTRVEDAILNNLKVFVAFARNKLGDHHRA